MADRISVAAREFKATFNVSHPRAVVLASNLWDIARVCMPRADGSVSSLCSGAYLPQSFLREWMANFTVTVQAVRQAFAPLTPLLIYHTEVRKDARGCGLLNCLEISLEISLFRPWSIERAGHAQGLQSLLRHPGLVKSLGAKQQ